MVNGKKIFTKNIQIFKEYCPEVLKIIIFRLYTIYH